MKRRFWSITASLIVGVVCTIGSSWYIASKEIPNHYFVFLSHSPAQIHDKSWMWPPDSSWPDHPQEQHSWAISRTHAVTTQTAFTRHREATDGHRVNYTLTRYTFGWPFQAMSSFSADRHIVHEPITGTAMGEPQGLLKYESLAMGVRLPSISQQFDIVNYPLVPSHVGFIVNTAIYGLMAFAILSAPGVIRSRRRTNRTKLGRCLECGYTLATLPTCPECNTPAPPRTIPQ